MKRKNRHAPFCDTFVGKGDKKIVIYKNHRLQSGADVSLDILEGYTYIWLQRTS